MGKLKIGEVFRYARPYCNTPASIDGLPNYFHVTNAPQQKLPILDSGINPIAEIKSPKGKRRPAILIRSAPHKIGSIDTPWQDTFDVDNGHIRYYGDNKTPGGDPNDSPGNKALLSAYKVHSSLDPEVRKEAIPLIFFRSVTFKGKQKGFVEFNGFGIIRDVQLVTQYDRANSTYFANYAFDFTVFSLANEKEQFDWTWINERRSIESIDTDIRLLAPASWKIWIKDGPKVIERCKRRVSRLFTASTLEQKPQKGSQELKALKNIYDFYTGKKSRFEGLAAIVTSRLVRNDGANYLEGWITPSTSDGGADFYGCIKIGSGFGQTKLIVLGQAKCESLNSPTGGNHIARTVARLKRGWVGAYVTTSYFSEAVQREIIEDSYPIILINGLTLATLCLQIVHDDGHDSLESFLCDVDKLYEGMIQARRPEELFYE